MGNGWTMGFVTIAASVALGAMGCGNSADGGGGAAAAGGTAGTPSSGGTPGTGGAAGTPGTGGTAGSPSTGGTSGAGGTSGTLGTGGTGGSEDCVGDGPPISADAIDIDCNLYNAVVIGEQRWFQTNLKTTRYRDGTLIPTGLSDEAWAATDQPAYAIYDNDPANDALYGKLYNWHAVKNPAGLCPTGWRVPTTADVFDLRTAIGFEANDGGKMKSTTGWEGPNTGATNSSGFDAKPGGQRFFTNGVFTDKTLRAAFWTSVVSANGGGVTFAFHFSFWYLADEFVDGERSQESGFSVRCIEE